MMLQPSLKDSTQLQSRPYNNVRDPKHVGHSKKIHFAKYFDQAKLIIWKQMSNKIEDKVDTKVKI